MLGRSRRRRAQKYSDSSQLNPAAGSKVKSAAFEGACIAVPMLDKPLNSRTPEIRRTRPTVMKMSLKLARNRRVSGSLALAPPARCSRNPSSRCAWSRLITPASTAARRSVVSNIHRLYCDAAIGVNADIGSNRHGLPGQRLGVCFVFDKGTGR